MYRPFLDMIYIHLSLIYWIQLSASLVNLHVQTEIAYQQTINATIATIAETKVMNLVVVSCPA